jgi:hypothetical protein
MWIYGMDPDVSHATVDGGRAPATDPSVSKRITV